jgi:hypothetical protein
MMGSSSVAELGKEADPAEQQAFLPVERTESYILAVIMGTFSKWNDNYLSTIAEP